METRVSTQAEEVITRQTRPSLLELTQASSKSKVVVDSPTESLLMKSLTEEAEAEDFDMPELYGETDLEWYYGVMMPAFKAGDHSIAEGNAKRLAELISVHFGKIPSPDPKFKSSRSYVLRSQGIFDLEHAYIKITCSRERLEAWAEEMKLQVKVREEHGGGFKTFSIAGKNQGIFSPVEKFEYLQKSVKSRSPSAVGQFSHEYLLPYQKMMIVQKQLHYVLDKLMCVSGRHGLKEAIKKKVITDVFPLHDTANTYSKTFVPRDVVVKKYLGIISTLFTPNLMSKRSDQVLEYFRSYFGEKTALFFSFLHFFTRWGFFMAVIGLGITSWQLIKPNKNYSVLVFSIVNSIWSSLFLEFWNRYNGILKNKWNMERYSETEEAFMPSLSASSVPGFYHDDELIDLTDFLEKQKKLGKDIDEFIPKCQNYEPGRFPKFLFCCFRNPELANTRAWRFFQSFVSSSVIITMSVGCIAAALALLVFRLTIKDGYTYGSIVSAVINALSIYVMNYIFNRIAVMLNNWEKHRTASQYEDRLISKIFFFQFVNSYFTLFYIAFVKGRGTLGGFQDKCSNLNNQQVDTCVIELGIQLAAQVLVRMSITFISDLVIPYYRNKFESMKKELQRKSEIKRKNPDLESDAVSNILKYKENRRDLVGQVERDGILPEFKKYGTSGLIYEYNHLAIQFGYLTLFGPAFPFLAVIIYVTNVVMNSVSGIKFLSEYRRPRPQGDEDLGSWYIVFKILSMLGVISSVAIIGFTSDELDDLYKPWGKLTNVYRIFILLIIGNICYFVQIFVNCIVPNKPRWLQKTIARTEMVNHIMADYTEYVALTQREREEVDELNMTRQVKITADHFGDTLKVDNILAGAANVPEMDDEKDGIV